MSQDEARVTEDARRRIEELETQMEIWKQKAAAAVDKCADFEDQIRDLQTVQRSTSPPRPKTSGSAFPSQNNDEQPRPTTSSSQKQSRFSFLTSRLSATAPLPPPKDGPYSQSVPIDLTLINELERERELRAKAEARAQKVDSEIEELSVQLFSQANEMVAEERKARAKLEERVELLERRDREKMGRLDRLEKAVSRIDRVKAILKEPDSTSLVPPPRK